MDLYDAVCHTFTAVSTGGFSTRNASMGAFNGYSQIIIILVMVAGGANFSAALLRAERQSQELPP